MSSPEIGIKCPTCGMFNQFDAATCVQCGRAIHAQNTVSQPPSEHSREVQIRKAHEAALSETPALLKRHEQHSRKSLRLIIALGALFILILLISLVSNRIKVLQWENRITADYQEAVTCFKNENYLCSRDKLSTLLKEAPNYPDAEDLLLTTQWELTQDYMANGQWEQAAAELVIMLPYTSERPEIRVALAQTYDARIQLAQARGDFGEVIRLNLERVSTLGF